MTRPLRLLLTAAGVLTLGWTCGVDQSLREYLTLRFWMPFGKTVDQLGGVEPRLSAHYAGMHRAVESTPLSVLRGLYQVVAVPEDTRTEPARIAEALARARADASLTERERDEVELIDAKLDLRTGQHEAARRKLEAFLKKARTPEYLSEARGWLARVHYLTGNQSAAGKLYLDELRRADSNLSRDVLLTSLRMTYGYRGGDKLVEQLEDYFDTPEHAAFAIRMATNPRRFRRSAIGRPSPRRRTRCLTPGSARCSKSTAGCSARNEARTNWRCWGCGAR